MTQAVSRLKVLKIGAVVLPLALLVVFFSWLQVGFPLLSKWLESKFAFQRLLLPEPLFLTYHIGLGLLPPIAVAAASSAAAYFRWYIPNRTRLANEHLAKLSGARRALTEAVDHLQMIEDELRSKASVADALRTEVEALRALSQESSSELELKIRAMQALNRGRLWFERGFAFFLGVLSSLVANYIWILLQPRP